MLIRSANQSAEEFHQAVYNHLSLILKKITRSNTKWGEVTKELQYTTAIEEIETRHTESLSTKMDYERAIAEYEDCNNFNDNMTTT